MPSEMCRPQFGPIGLDYRPFTVPGNDEDLVWVVNHFWLLLTIDTKSGRVLYSGRTSRLTSLHWMREQFRMI